MASLGAAIGFAAVTILDKVILGRHVASAWVFIFFAGLMQLPGALVPMAFVAFPGYPITLWLAALGSGAAFGMSLVLMFWTLRRQDASLVTAVYLSIFRNYVPVEGQIAKNNRPLRQEL